MFYHGPAGVRHTRVDELTRSRRACHGDPILLCAPSSSSCFVHHHRHLTVCIVLVLFVLCRWVRACCSTSLSLWYPFFLVVSLSPGGIPLSSGGIFYISQLNSLPGFSFDTFSRSHSPGPLQPQVPWCRHGNGKLSDTHPRDLPVLLTYGQLDPLAAILLPFFGKACALVHGCHAHPTKVTRGLAKLLPHKNNEGFGKACALVHGCHMPIPQK